MPDAEPQKVGELSEIAERKMVPLVAPDLQSSSGSEVKPVVSYNFSEEEAFQQVCEQSETSLPNTSLVNNDKERQSETSLPNKSPVNSYKRKAKRNILPNESLKPYLGIKMVGHEQHLHY